MTKYLARVAMALFAVGAIAPVWATAANAASTITVTGTVHCSSASVVGVWIQSSGGGSGFAGWQAYNTPDNASFSKTFSTNLPTNVQLRVGCGGTSQSWGSTRTSSARTINGSHVENVLCGTNNVCNWPARGKTTVRNIFPAGWCTYGAIQDWHAYNAVWPYWTGDAAKWSTTAAQNGWTVTAVPMRKSIVVVPGTASNPAGHVMWVNDIVLSSSGAVSLKVHEMNFDWTGGAPTGHTRNWTYTPKSTWRYILTP